nr:hypothetical protein CFP56_30196 [Quercus suber]
MVLEAGYPNTTGFRKVTKATILVKKKPGMSDAAFIEHYNHRHAQLAAPVLQKHHVLTYSLVHLLPATRSHHLPGHAAWAGEPARLRRHLHVCVSRLSRLRALHVRPGEQGADAGSRELHGRGGDEDDGGGRVHGHRGWGEGGIDCGSYAAIWSCALKELAVCPREGDSGLLVLLMFRRKDVTTWSTSKSRSYQLLLLLHFRILTLDGPVGIAQHRPDCWHVDKIIQTRFRGRERRTPKLVTEAQSHSSKPSKPRKKEPVEGSLTVRSTRDDGLSSGKTRVLFGRRIGDERLRGSIPSFRGGERYGTHHPKPTSAINLCVLCDFGTTMLTTTTMMIMGHPLRDSSHHYRTSDGYISRSRLETSGSMVEADGRMMEALAQLESTIVSTVSGALEAATSEDGCHGDRGLTYILTFRSSPALAKMPGFVGCQATALTVPAEWASSEAICMPV